MYQGRLHVRTYSGVHAQPRTYMLSYKPGWTVVKNMYTNFIIDRIHARNCRSCLAQYRRGGGGRYLTKKREGEEPLSLTFIGRLMPLEIVVNCAIVYSLTTILLCYKCMMQASENFTLGRSLYKTLRSIKTLRSQNATLVPRKLYVNVSCVRR